MSTALQIGDRVRVNAYPYAEPGATGTIVAIDAGRPFGLDYLFQPDGSRQLQPNTGERVGGRTYHSLSEIEVVS